MILKYVFKNDLENVTFMSEKSFKIILPAEAEAG